ncbi:MAG: hypothetical protein OEZ43_06220 [Gammaproteobacteria bacterium]|nr:hypothetical protein [Gammaproteobacteria bacterium]
MMTKQRIFIVLLLLALTPSLAMASSEREKKNKNPGSLIIDNSLGKPGSMGITTNMRVGLDDDSDDHHRGDIEECENEHDTISRSCNSFELEDGADLQVIQRNTQDQLRIESGVFNTESTSYNNFGTDNQLRLFENENHLFDIARFREAAKKLSLITTTAEPFTYGNITWKQFIDNVAHARTMHGIVRVEIPLQRLSDVPRSSNEEHRYRSRSGKRYGFCGKEKIEKCGCGPGTKREGGDDDDYDETHIKPGEKICDIKIPSFARIDVRGSILFEWVDCDTREPIALEDLPEKSEDLQIKVSVPLSINPALADTDTSMKNTLAIAALTAGKSCGPGRPCSFPFEVPLSASSLLPPASDSRFHQLFSASEYAALSHPMRYGSLMPSGYTKGWVEAFQTLGITGAKWRSYGFQTPTSDSAIINAEDIHVQNNTPFEDIPVYMYTGGLFKLEHHINISGLLYIPRALDLEQEGIELERKVKKHDEEYEREDDHYREYSHFKRVYRSESEYHDHEYSSCPKKTEHYETEIPAKQYISGAIVVRDGFSIEVEDGGGATIIANDPATYDNMRGSGGSHMAKGFVAFKKETTASPGNSGGNNPSSGSGNQNGSNNDDQNNNGNTGPSTGNRPTLPLWMEIRPR